MMDPKHYFGPAEDWERRHGLLREDRIDRQRLTAPRKLRTRVERLKGGCLVYQLNPSLDTINRSDA